MGYNVIYALMTKLFDGCDLMRLIKKIDPRGLVDLGPGISPPAIRRVGMNLNKFGLVVDLPTLTYANSQNGIKKVLSYLITVNKIRDLESCFLGMQTLCLSANVHCLTNIVVFSSVLFRSKLLALIKN